VAASGLAAAIGTHTPEEYREVAKRYQIRSRTKRVVVEGSGGRIGVYVENAVPSYTGTLADECVANPLHSREEAEAIAALPDVLIDRDELVIHCEGILEDCRTDYAAKVQQWFEEWTAQQTKGNNAQTTNATAS